MIVSKIKNKNGVVTYFDTLTAKYEVGISMFTTNSDFNSFQFEEISDHCLWAGIKVESPRPTDGINTAVLSLRDMKQLRSELHNVIRWALKIRPKVEFNAVDKARFRATLFLLRGKNNGFKISHIYNPSNCEDGFIYVVKS